MANINVGESLVDRVQQWFNDIKYYFKFRKFIKREYDTPGSTFNKLNLSINWLGNAAYVQLNFSENDAANFNYDMSKLIMSGLKDYIEYFSDNDWDEYVGTEISQFVDSTGEGTLSFAVVFIYTPYRFSLSRALKRLGYALLGGIILASGYFIYLSYIK